MVRPIQACADRQQRGELVPGGGRVPGSPGPVGQVEPGHQGIRGVRAEDALADAEQRGELVPGGGRVSRRSPSKFARLWRLVKVSGCSGPSTRSATGSSAANWSRAAAASPACPVQ